MDNHASYIDSWLKVLKNDKKAIFTAASQASKSHSWLMAAVNAASMRKAA
jgi:antirestriction protein ArdC